jgi:hypothetical protein
MRKLVTAACFAFALEVLPGVSLAQVYVTPDSQNNQQCQDGQRPTQAIIYLNPKQGQNPMVGFQDGNGYIWQTPQTGQPQPNSPYGYQDNSGNILIFPKQTDR